MVLLLTIPELGHAFRGHRHRHGRVRSTVVFSVGPYFGPLWYPPVVVQPAPYISVRPVPYIYVQPAPQVVAPQPQPQYWYYCEDSQGYYPYVQQCPSGWRPVAPTP